MSMENAILKHAEALLALSEALNAMNAGRASALALPEAGGNAIRRNTAEEKAEFDKGCAQLVETMTANAAEMSTDRQTKPATEQVKPDAELEKAVTKVEETAKAEETKVLDYATDVKPVLLQLAKKQRQLLVDLLAKYNAKNGEAIQAKDFAAVIAEAQAQLAA